MSTMRVLVIEDDRMIGSFVERNLRESGFVVDHAVTARQGQRLLFEKEYAAIVLDLGLPDMDGSDVLNLLRNQGLTTPVLILSARRTLDARIRGLEQGADDYLIKPFAAAELNARVRNLMKRDWTTATVATTLKAADLTLDLLRREARRGTRELSLTAQEFTLLEYLCRNVGRVVTRSMILDHVWKLRIDPETNVVAVHINRLRHKVEAPGEAPLIRTLRGTGYILTTS